MVCHFVSHFAFRRQVKFQGAKTSGPKRVAEEVILEVEDLAASAKQQKLDDTVPAVKPIANQTTFGSFKKPQNRNGFSQKSSLANLVKRKTTATVTATATAPTATATATATSTSGTPTDSTNEVLSTGTSTASKPTTNTTNALSLLSGYDNYSDSDNSD